MPDPDRSTHCALLVDRGVHLIEIMRLEDIARDKIFEFLFIALPLLNVTTLPRRVTFAQPKTRVSRRCSGRWRV